MRRRRLWTRWIVGLIVILILAAAAAWLSSLSHSGRTIHFWMDDATGLEPGTVVNLSGVRAGAVAYMNLDADPAHNGAPRAKVRVRLTNEAIDLVNPREWVVAVTSSPLPGFKAGVDLVRHQGEPLPELPDGAWHTDSTNAVTKQVNLAFDALIHKVREISGTSSPDGTFSLRDLFPHKEGEEGGDPALVSWMFNQEQVGLLTGVLRNIDSITGTAVKHQEQGGLAQAALGAAAHSNLMRATDDLTQTVHKLKSDLDKSGNLLELVLTKDDARRVSDVLRNIDSITGAVAVDQRDGGLARAALGAGGHANLLQLTEDLTKTVGRLRGELEGDGNLLELLLAKKDSDTISGMLRKFDALAGSAVESQKIGGLAHTALGAGGHANLMRLTEDAAAIAGRVRTDLEDDGTLLQLLFTKEDSDKISDLLGNVDVLSKRVAAFDLTPIQEGVRSLAKVREALDSVAGMVTRLVAQRPDGRPSELEEELAELPVHLKTVYESIEKASRSTDEIMEQTAEVLRKANLTVSSLNQIMTGLKRSWLFRGAFNESLRYEDLAPYLVPSGTPSGGEEFDIDQLLKTLDGGE